MSKRLRSLPTQWLALLVVAAAVLVSTVFGSVGSADFVNASSLSSALNAFVPLTGTGAGAAAVGSDRSTTYYLPIVRGDTGYDTIIHIANATGGPNSYTVTFYDSSGKVVASPAAPLGPWQTVDLHAGQSVSTAFVGSARVSSTGGVGVAAEVIDSNNGTTTDNVDAYAGLTSPTTLSYIPLGFNAQGYVSNLYLQNPGSSSATVTLTFFEHGNTVTTQSVAVPAHGSTQVNASQISALSGWAGPIELSSTVPILAAEELLGGGTYGIATARAIVTPPTVYLPRFAATNGSGWNTIAILTNAGTGAVTFTATFYKPDGSVVQTATSGSISPNADWVLGPLPGIGQDPGLPSGFAGSAVITSSSSSAVVPFALDAYVNNGVFTALASYPLSNAPPSGAALNLPGLRSSIAGESTAFTLLNTQSTVQSYQVAFWNQSGSTLLETSPLVTLAPHQVAYFSQAGDPKLAGQIVAAEVTNQTPGGLLPVGVIESFSGTFAPPPSPYPTPTGTPTPASTATGSPVVGTPTLTPTVTPTATASMVNGLIPNGMSAYHAVSEGRTTFYLPIVRSAANGESIIHLLNSTGSQNVVHLAFYNVDGGASSTLDVPLAGFASTDVDVGRQIGANFDGWASATASTAFALSVDVYNSNGTAQDNFDSYAGLTDPGQSVQVSAANSFKGFNSIIDVVNLGSTATTATLSYLVNVGTPASQPTPVTASVTIPPFARVQVDTRTVTGIPASNWAGTVQIRASQPLLAMTEITGNNSYAVVGPIPSGPSANFYFPKFDSQTPPDGLYSTIILTNTGTSDNVFSLFFYNPDGSSTGNPVSVTVAPSQTVGEYGASPPFFGLPHGFLGSARVTDTTGNATAGMLKIMFNNFFFHTLATYEPDNVVPPGRSLFLPALKNSAGTMSTAFTIMNVQPGPQSYSIVYRDLSGAVVKTDTVSNLPSFGSRYFSQANDPALPIGGTFSAEVDTTTDGGALPIALVDLYGTYTVPAPAAFTPTVTPTRTSTITPTFSPTLGPGTPSLTPSPTATLIVADRYEPDDTKKLARPLSLDFVPQSHSIDPLGDHDWVGFNVPTAERLRFLASGSSCDIQMTLFGSDGVTALAFDDDSGDSFGSQVTYDFTTPGTYYLMVRNYITQATGALWIDPVATRQGLCGAYQLSGGISANAPTSTPTTVLAATATPLPLVSPALNGTSDYAAGTDQDKVYDLPLVRTGGGFNSYIHVASASSMATNVSVSFYDVNGNANVPAGLQSVPLASGASFDVDASKYVGSSFNGSALVSAGSNAVAVAVEYVNPALSQDSYDSYAGLSSSANNAYVMGAKAGQFLTFDTVIHVHNPTGNTAHVSITFEGTSAAAISGTIPPFGSMSPTDVGQLGDVHPGWVGAAHIVSDQPITAVSETTGAGASSVPQSYGIAPMFTSLSGTTAYVPHFINVMNGTQPGWSSVLMLQNASSQAATFSVKFINGDGSQALAQDVSIQGNKSQILGGLAGNLSLPVGFNGSALVSSPGSTWAMMALDTYATSSTSASITAIGNFVVPIAQPTGNLAVAPALRKNLNGVSTTLTVMNSSNRAQDYAITYVDYGGHALRTDTFSLNPSQSWTFDQSTDTGLGGSFEGSARIVNIGTGFPPIVEVQSFGGSFVPPQPLTKPLPTPFSTPTGGKGSRTIYLPIVPDQKVTR